MGWQDAPIVESAPVASGSWRDAPIVQTAPTVEESPYSLKNLAGAATEPILALGSGAVAAPLSGLAGIGTAIGNKLGLTDKDPADVVRSVGDSLTYHPRTQGGQTANDAITWPLQKIAEGADYVGSNVADITGSPALGAAANTAIQAIPQVAAFKYGAKLPAKSETSLSTPKQLLVDKGVTMTPGQLLGGAAGRIESGLESLPIAGDFIKAAKANGVTDFSNAAINEALTPVGEKLPAGLKGNAAIEHAENILGDKYDAIKTNLVGRLDGPEISPSTELQTAGQSGEITAQKPSFRAELNNLKEMGAEGLSETQAAILNRIIDKEIIGKFTDAGLASGETLKNIQSRLAEISKGYGRSEDYQVRDLGDAVQEANAALRRMIEDENPQYAGELAAINSGYAKFKIVQRAAAAQGSKEGVFTPAQLDNAVKAKDFSKDKGRYARGDATLQDFSSAGKTNLLSSVPDSGTALRMSTLGAVGAISGGAQFALGPLGTAAALAVPLLYSKPVLRAIQPAIRNPVAAGNVAAKMSPSALSQDALENFKREALQRHIAELRSSTPAGIIRDAMAAVDGSGIGAATAGSSGIINSQRKN